MDAFWTRPLFQKEKGGAASFAFVPGKFSS
jgi:hypothetical protein